MSKRASGKSLGVAACTAIVVGNMVGSGFYLSPAAVAPYGNLAIIAWIVMGIGAACLGLTFAKLARLAPATGGPYAYTRMAYGDFAGFLVAWGYWISIWTSLPVIAIAFAGAVMDLVPSLHNRTMAVVLTLGAIWAVVLVNLRGVKAAGTFSQITTYTKMIPFAAIALIGLFFIDTSHFSEFNPSGKSLLGASAALAPLTMFAFLGLESATVPAGDVVDPKRTIPRSTVLGITYRHAAVRARHYSRYGPRSARATSAFGRPVLRCCAGVMGPVGRNDDLARRDPFGDRRSQWLDAADGSSADGCSARRIVSALFRPALAAGVPAIGIVISAILATLLVLSQVAGPPGFSPFYNLVVGLSTMAAVIPYAFCALATGLVAAYAAGGGPVPRLTIVEVIAFIFAVFTLYGCGAEPVLYGCDNAGAGHPCLTFGSDVAPSPTDICALSAIYEPCTVRFHRMN